jgi:hypothetical protein
LDLVFDNALSTLIIDRPEVGEVCPQDGVLARGAAPLGARLFVNDQKVALDSKGRFDERLPPAKKVVFHLVERNGVETFWVRALRTDDAAGRVAPERISRRPRGTAPGKRSSRMAGAQGVAQ